MKKIKLFALALLLSVSSLSVLAPRTYAATRTWTGGGGNNNMSTAANWGGSAPVTGDDLVFPAGAARNTVVNDLTAGTSFNSITFSGTVEDADDRYTISGNSMTLAGNITISATTTNSYVHEVISAPLIISGNRTLSVGDGSLELSGTVAGSGDLTKTGSGLLVVSGSNSSYGGNVTVSAGSLIVTNAAGLGTAVGGTTVASGASINFSTLADGTTISEPLNLSGVGSGAYPHAFNVSHSYGGGSATKPYPTVTFSGAITLGSNIVLNASQRTVKLTGACSGNFTISPAQGASGTVEIASSPNNCATPNGTLQGATYTTAYDDNEPGTDIYVSNKETAVVKGTYGSAIVEDGGTLKGTGTIGDLTVRGGGIVAPGLSPGCLSTQNLTLEADATYQFEIGGANACTGYDQLKVTGIADVTGAILSTNVVNDFKPVAGATYTIIDNDDSDAVEGTFKDLAEGATFTVNGFVFKISYVGGDGNDVTLTVQSVPATPDTGFATLTNNPLLSMSIVLGAAVAIAIAARRTSRVTVRSRR